MIGVPVAHPVPATFSTLDGRPGCRLARGSSAVPGGPLDTTVAVSPDATWVRRSGAIARFLCVLTLLDGSVVMAGWILGLPILPSVLPGAEATKPDTAIALIAAALAWLLLHPGATEPIRPSRIRVNAARILAGLVVLLGLIVLIEIIRGKSIGPDTFFVRAMLPQSADTYSERMSAAAGATFMLLGGALLWLTLGRQRPAWPVQLVAHIILFSAIVPLAGDLYDSATFRATPIVGTTALPTALGFLAMGIALMGARPTEGVMSLFTSTGAGGHFARRAIFFFVAVPFVLNFGEVFGELSGWYPQRTGWILESGFIGVGLLGLSWLVAAALDRREAQRQQVVNELAQSERRLRLIAETIDEVFWMSNTDVETIDYVSPAFDRVWGWPRAHLYDHPRSFFEAVHPDDRERVAEDLKLERRSGRPYDHEYRIVRPDGEVRWIWARGFPVHDPDGQVRQYVGVAQDATARKQSQEQLRQSVERFELAALATHDAIWDFDAKSGVAWWSDDYYERYGYSRDTTPSLAAWADHLHPEDRERVTRSFNSALERGAETWSEDFRYKRADGSYAEVLDRAYIARDASGAVSRVLGSVQDITERRSLEAQLHQAQKMEAIGQLAGGVAHDFNNLLTIMHGYATFIADEETLTPDTKESAGEIINSAERAARLTRQLLLFSRRQVVQRTHFDVNEAVRAMGRMLTRILGEDVHLEFELAERPLFVDADAGMVDQILMNLVVNSRDAMPKGGLLIIETVDRIVADDGTIPSQSDAEPGPYVRISVGDTGEGISPDVLPHIFEPFFSTKPAGKGTGLGLATVFGIVKQHRGWVDVESQSGEGTAFRVWLPLSETQAAVSPAAAVVGAGSGSETVLLVEDEAPVLALMSTALERKGYRVLPASKAADALQLWQSQMDAIRVLVTDMVLPLGISGRDLVAQLRVQRPDLKVLFVSGYSADFAGREITLEAGEHFLQKPFTPARLVESLRTCIDGPAGGAQSA
jgi:PAS domain S-box-containing protein